MYDLSTVWTVGGKYAYRLGEWALDRNNREFFDSRASLYVCAQTGTSSTGADALVEVRRLDLPTRTTTAAGCCGDVPPCRRSYQRRESAITSAISRMI